MNTSDVNAVDAPLSTPSVSNTSLPRSTATGSAQSPNQGQPWSQQHIDHWVSREHSKAVTVDAVDIPAACIEEIYNASLHNDLSSPLQDTARQLPKCSKFAASVRHTLINEAGYIVINGFPVDRYDTETLKANASRAMAGWFSALLAPVMAQDIKGTTLYDVIDTGAQDDGAVRRSKTNVSQPFHTDGPWFEKPPHLVGLFCIQPAITGGFSQVSSLQVALKHLIESGQIDKQCLYNAACWNKMSVHQPDDAPYSILPVAEFTEQNMLLRHYADYVTSGYRLADKTAPESIVNALQLLDATLAEFACEPFRLEAGQLLYLNNWTVTHARKAFADTAESGARHLVRLWNHESVTVTQSAAKTKTAVAETEMA